MEAAETPRHRRRWFQFRLSHLLAFVLLVCGILAWGRQRMEIIELHHQVDRLERELAIKTNRLKIQRILRSSKPDDEKMQELSSFIEIGDSLQHLKSVLGECDLYVVGSLWNFRNWSDLDLDVRFDPNCRVDSIGYHRYEDRGLGTSVTLRSSGKIHQWQPIIVFPSSPSSP